MLIFVLAGMNINDLIYFEDDCLINYDVNYSCILLHQGLQRY